MIEKRRIGAVVRECLILIIVAWACVAVLQNVLNYREVFLQNEQKAETAAAWLNSPNKHVGPMADLDVRVNFYTLLETLGKDESLHQGDTGVYVADPDFFDGAYTDKPGDTVLGRCAIQPFAIPALTGMPLIAALRSRENGCKYDSYGYQYLPRDTSITASDIAQPCALASLRGLKKVVVINRHEELFFAKKVNCGSH